MKLLLIFASNIYYAALLRRRGPHIALHSVCLSVRLSVRPVITYLFFLEHRSRVFVNLADVRYLLFCLHFRAAYSTAISAAQACWRLQPTAAGRRGRFSEMHTARVAQQCLQLHANCPQMIHKKQWPHNSPNLTPLQFHPKPNKYSY